MNFNDFTNKMKTSDNLLLIEAIQSGYSSIFEENSGRNLVFDPFDYLEQSDFDDLINRYSLDREAATSLISAFNNRHLPKWTPGAKNLERMYSLGTLADELTPLSKNNYAPAQIRNPLVNIYRKIDSRFSNSVQLPSDIIIPDGVPLDEFTKVLKQCSSNTSGVLTISDVNKGTQIALDMINTHQSESPSPTSNGNSKLSVVHSGNMNVDVQNGAHPLYREWRSLSGGCVSTHLPAFIMRHLAK